MLLVLKLAVELVEAPLYVPELDLLQAQKLLSGLLQKFETFFVGPLSSQKQFLKRDNIGFELRGHFFNLSERVSIVFIKDTL